MRDYLRAPILLIYGSSAAVKVTSLVLGFIMTIILARQLGPAGFGVYSYVFAVISVLGIFSQLGVPALVMRETARGEFDADWPRVKALWRWSTRVVLALSIAAILVGAVFALLAWDRMDSEEIWTLGFGMLLVPTMALGALRGAALRGLRRVVIGLLPDHVLRPFMFIVLLFLSTQILVQISPYQAMGLHVLAAFFAFLCGALMLWYHMPRQLRGATGTSAGTRPWLRASVAFALATGMEQISIYSGILILGLFEPSEEVGFYRIAFQVSIIVGFGLQTVGLVVAPHFARLSQDSDKRRLEKLAIASARLSTALAVVATVAILVWGEEILRLAFGPPYVASLTPLLILACAQLLGAFFGPIAILMKMSGHERGVAARTAVAAGCNIALNFLLIPAMGMEGAALATLISFAVLNLSLWYSARRLMGVNVAAIARALATRGQDLPRTR